MLTCGSEGELSYFVFQAKNLSVFNQVCQTIEVHYPIQSVLFRRVASFQQLKHEGYLLKPS